MLTLIPAYGRDYKSKEDVLRDWNADKDFLIADVTNPWCGKPINFTDFKNANMKCAEFRYRKLRRSFIYNYVKDGLL